MDAGGSLALLHSCESLADCRRNTDAAINSVLDEEGLEVIL
jgi:hypothetical protein